METETEIARDIEIETERLKERNRDIQSLEYSAVSLSFLLVLKQSKYVERERETEISKLTERKKQTTTERPRDR